MGCDSGRHGDNFREFLRAGRPGAPAAAVRSLCPRGGAVLYAKRYRPELARGRAGTRVGISSGRAIPGSPHIIAGGVTA